jgi:hypothetical protein
MILVLLSALVTQVPFPLHAGDRWSYAGSVRRVEPHSGVGRIRTRRIRWTMEVLEVADGAGYHAARIRGAPGDLIWADGNFVARESIWVQARGGLYHLELGDGESIDLGDENALRARLTEDALLLVWPLTPGRVYGCDTPNRSPIGCWSVEGVREIAHAKSHLLIYRTNAGPTTMTFVPGLGITRFEYHHHGTAYDLELRLQKLSTREPRKIERTREEREVVVDGKKERWRLVWLDPPQPYCHVAAESITAPCRGFEDGEAGELDLVRLRDGREVDRLHLTPLYTGNRALLPKRPVLKLADYDRDGAPTELVLQVEAIDSSTYPSVLVGLDPRTRRLWAYGTAEHPEEPLVLIRPSLWRTLLDSAASDLVETHCGDHGSEQEDVLHLSADRAGLQAAVDSNQSGQGEVLVGKRSC